MWINERVFVHEASAFYGNGLSPLNEVLHPLQALALFRVIFQKKLRKVHVYIPESVLPVWKTIEGSKVFVHAMHEDKMPKHISLSPNEEFEILEHDLQCGMLRRVFCKSGNFSINDKIQIMDMGSNFRYRGNPLAPVQLRITDVDSLSSGNILEFAPTAIVGRAIENTIDRFIVSPSFRAGGIVSEDTKCIMAIHFPIQEDI